MHTSSQQDTHSLNSNKRPDGGIDPAGEAGWYLQRERLDRNISLEQASQAVNIHPYHLTAIEQGDLTGLPGRRDALEMIGAYASFLGFDPEPLVQHFAQFLPKQPMPGHRQPQQKTKNQRPRPLSSAKILKFPLLTKLGSMSTGAGGIVASCLGAVMLFGVASWVFMPAERLTTGPDGQIVAERDAAKREKVASVSTTTQMPMPEDGGKVASDADKSANSLTGLDKLIAKSSIGDPIQTASLPKKSTAAVKQVDASKAASNGGRVYGAQNKKARLVLKANSNVWVRIEDARGNVVMTRTLMQGDSYRVPDRKGLVVIARDGGLLSFSVDGKDRGNLGQTGEILVGLPLDISALNKDKG